MTHNDLLIKLFETEGDPDQLYEVCDMIMVYIKQCCSENRLDKLDLLFTLISTDCVPTTYLTMLLRGSFCLIRYLKNWKDLRNRAIASSALRGERTDHTFRGLDDKSIDESTPSVLVQRCLGLQVNSK